ncbi:histidine kinase [Roseateles aquatilis]|uniref:histidine kinase n=1 Tax=Roseateles aquatilis TaxID=431061 RepID=A0A246JKK3_9BURK|nr:ATP-binding protein [Roseateles aquatilis]OWQ93176.1 histidine kinase [Roseateles aquatilis]
MTSADARRRASPLALLVLLGSIGVLAAMGAVLAGAMGLHLPSSGLHLVQAEWQEAPAPAFTAPAPAIDSRALPATWQPVSLPLALPAALLQQARAAETAPPQPTVLVTWLRVAVPPGAPASGPLALYGARVKTDGTVAVYIDGRLVHRAQQDGPLWNSTRTPLWVELGPAQGRPPAREILLRLEHSSKSRVALSSLWLGDAGLLQGRRQVRQWLQQSLPAALGAAFMVIGVFSLFVWLRRRHEIGYLLFFNLAATSWLRGLHFHLSLPIANDGFAWLTVNALFWLVMVVHFFLRQLHGRPLRWLTRVVVATTVIIGVLTLPPVGVLLNTPRVTPLLYAVAALMGATVGLVGGLCAWRESREGRSVAVGIGLCTLLGMTDWLLQNNFVSPEGWYLGVYVNAVALSVFGSLIYRRYVDAIAAVERVNAGLEERLAAREAELQASHRRLREVEMRQTISDERQRLMQDMHDGLGSSLISAIRSVERGGLGDAAVSQVLKDCLDDLKLTIDSMEPIEADLLLLLATLRFRLEPRLEGTGVTLLWEVRELPALPWLDPSSGLHILRIVQESIANILRHTRATQIRVSTAVVEDGVSVSIEDNGLGFDADAALAQPSSGRGLQNQQRRAQAVRGRVDWRSGATGTVFTLWLPREHPPHP